MMSLNVIIKPFESLSCILSYHLTLRNYRFLTLLALICCLHTYLQKQSPGGTLETNCFEKFYKFCRLSNLFTRDSGVSCVLSSSHPEVFSKKAVLNIFSNFTGKHLCQGLFLIKLMAGGLQLIKKEADFCKGVSQLLLQNF